MANGGDCVLRSATRFPSLHRSGLERQGHNGTVAATGVLIGYWLLAISLYKTPDGWE
jgi:hypothetical protein